MTLEQERLQELEELLTHVHEQLRLMKPEGVAKLSNEARQVIGELAVAAGLLSW